MKKIVCMVICSLLISYVSAFAETCICDSPCSGSRTCPDGCWAFCEERRGGNYCAKGCVYDTADMQTTGVLNIQAKLNSVDIKMQKEHVKPLLERLYGIKLDSGITSYGNDNVVINSKNLTFNDLLNTLKERGVNLNIK